MVNETVTGGNQDVIALIRRYQMENGKRSTIMKPTTIRRMTAVLWKRNLRDFTVKAI
jgi:hypothetical protein